MTALTLSRFWELCMRFTPAAIALSAMLAMVSSTSFSQPPAHNVDPRSQALVDEGYAAQKKGELVQANDLYEAALAVDPANRAAYIALAQVARSQSLPGKAVRYYREALRLDPEDQGALAGQGEALIQRGAVEKARGNLARLRSLCRQDCAAARDLAAALEAQANKPVLSAEAVTTSPTVSTTREHP